MADEYNAETEIVLSSYSFSYHDTVYLHTKDGNIHRATVDNLNVVENLKITYDNA